MRITSYAYPKSFILVASRNCVGGTENDPVHVFPNFINISST